MHAEIWMNDKISILLISQKENSTHSNKKYVMSQSWPRLLLPNQKCAKTALSSWEREKKATAENYLRCSI